MSTSNVEKYDFSPTWVNYEHIERPILHSHNIDHQPAITYKGIQRIWQHAIFSFFTPARTIFNIFLRKVKIARLMRIGIEITIWLYFWHVTRWLFLLTIIVQSLIIQNGFVPDLENGITLNIFLFNSLHGIELHL